MEATEVLGKGVCVFSLIKIFKIETWKTWVIINNKAISERAVGMLNSN